MPKHTSSPGSTATSSGFLKNSSYWKNQRITFQKNEITNDEYENQLQEWTDYFECWAYASTKQASETDGDIPQDVDSITFETRYCPELADINSVEYRIVFKNRFYDIISIDLMNYQHQSIKFLTRSQVEHTQQQQ